MTPSPSEDQYRRFLETELGVDVGAGLRMEHLLQAFNDGRVFVDLLGIPKDRRFEIYKEIVALVRQRSVQLRTAAAEASEPVTAAG